MVKNVIYNLIFLSIGFLIGYFSGCNKGAQIITNEVNKVIFDTVTVKVNVPITKIKTTYINSTDTIVKHLTDSVFIEVIKNNPMEIPTNDYSDTIETDNYVFSYFIGTVGELMIFNPEITCKPLVRIIEPKQKDWSLSLGISNKLTYKIGAGYKGWQIESDFSPNNINKVYFTKQFNF